MSLVRRRKIIIGLIISLAFSVIVVLSLLFQPAPKGMFLIDSGEIVSFAMGINDEGLVYGLSSTQFTRMTSFQWTLEKGVIFPDKKEEIDRVAFVRKENSLGQRIENIGNDEDSIAYIIQKDGSRYKLPLLGGNKSRAIAINNKGQVVGFVTVPLPWWKKSWNWVANRFGFPLFPTHTDNSAKAVIWTVSPEDK